MCSVMGVGEGRSHNGWSKFPESGCFPDPKCPGSREGTNPLGVGGVGWGSGIWSGPWGGPQGPRYFRSTPRAPGSTDPCEKGRTGDVKTSGVGPAIPKVRPKVDKVEWSEPKGGDQVPEAIPRIPGASVVSPGPQG